MKYGVQAVLVLVLSMAAVRAQAPASISNDEWKRWLDRVDPLMLQAERKEAKGTAPSDRAKFQEAFWQARNPNSSNADNTVRAQFEIRIRTAEREKRFLIGGGKWTDCGRTFLVLGKPDSQRNIRAPISSGGDPSFAFQNQDQFATEEWIYRANPKPPLPPEGYVFRFNAACRSVSGRTASTLLDQVAESYVVHPH